MSKQRVEAPTQLELSSFSRVLASEASEVELLIFDAHQGLTVFGMVAMNNGAVLSAKDSVAGLDEVLP